MWLKSCLPTGRFLCLAAASWLCVDHSQSHAGTPPPRCGWGNTWSQPLQPGSWAEVLAISRRLLFVYAFGIIQHSAAENVFILSKLVSLYLVARNHTSPEGCVHKTLPCRLLQLLTKMTKCGSWRNAVSSLKTEQKSLHLKFLLNVIALGHTKGYLKG